MNILLLLECFFEKFQCFVEVLANGLVNLIRLSCIFWVSFVALLQRSLWTGLGISKDVSMLREGIVITLFLLVLAGLAGLSF